MLQEKPPVLWEVPKAIPGQESVFLEIMKRTALALIPESVLGREDMLTTQTRVVMML